jgi:hypothetical protein
MARVEATTASVEGLACSVAAQGEAERAAKLFGAMDTLYEAMNYNETPADRGGGRRIGRLPARSWKRRRGTRRGLRVGL